jgi:N-carbamoyl-L-amino-acid hydrolase
MRCWGYLPPAVSLEQIIGELDGIGIRDSGVHRMAWSDEDAHSRAWFERRAAQAGLRFLRDPAGNLWACPQSSPPWWAVGSHLDSVRGGGRFDGPLGVACGFEIAGRAELPVAVISFADEEGARFNTPTFGSKALTGQLDLATVLERRDDSGVTLRAAFAGAGLDPGRIADAQAWLAKLRGFVEVHIDQGTEVCDAGAPVGIASSLASRIRVEVSLHGQADHAGATPAGERRDALGTAARLIVAAEELAAGPEQLRVACPRILVEPNAPTTIAARVRLWLDARGPEMATIERWLARLGEWAAELTAKSGVDVALTVASRSEGREFRCEVRRSLAEAGRELIDQPAPELMCFAGHDSGVLADRVPAGLLLVRNRTGVSHSPEETVDLQDAELAARVVERALERLG